MAAEGHRLESWKEIADYLGKSVRTANRWAKDLGMPVHRDAGGQTDRIVAYSGEIDRWRNSHIYTDAIPGEDHIANGDRPTEVSDSPIENQPLEVSASPIEPVAEIAETLDIHPQIGELVEDISIQASTVRKQSRQWRIGLAIGLIAAAGMLFFVGRWLTGWGMKADTAGPVSSVRMEGSTLLAYNSKGIVTWQKTFDGLIKRDDALRAGSFPIEARLSACEDLNGDGANEILAVTENRGANLAPGVLHLLDDSGKERWRFQPGQKLIFGEKQIDDMWAIHWFLLNDLDGDGRMEIVLVSYSVLEFPAKISVLRPDGEKVGEYVHSGHIKGVALADLNGDGLKEIIAGGINNGYGKGAAFVLDLRALSGASPQRDTPPYRCADLPEGREVYFLLFPRDCINRAVEPFGGIDTVNVSKDKIVFGTICTLLKPCPNCGQLLYSFTHYLRPLDVQPNSGYAQYHRCLEEQRLLDHPYSEEEILDLEPVLYWDGEQFTSKPKMNRYWIK